MVSQTVSELRLLVHCQICTPAFCLFACLLSFVGCNEPAQLSVENPNANQPAMPALSDRTELTSSGGLTDKVKFKSGAETTVFSLKPMDDGAKLVDANEREIARYNLSESKLKIKGPNDKVLGYITASGSDFKVKNAEQDVELWKLQQQDDGEWKLEDGNDKIIYKIKMREYGYEIEDNADNSLYKVKFKDGKTSLRDQEEKTVCYTKDNVSTLAVTCLGFEEIESLEIKAGLLTMFIIDSD